MISFFAHDVVKTSRPGDVDLNAPTESLRGALSDKSRETSRETGRAADLSNQAHRAQEKDAPEAVEIRLRHQPSSGTRTAAARDNTRRHKSAGRKGE